MGHKSDMCIKLCGLNIELCVELNNYVQHHFRIMFVYIVLPPYTSPKLASYLKISWFDMWFDIVKLRLSETVDLWSYILPIVKYLNTL